MSCDPHTRAYVQRRKDPPEITLVLDERALSLAVGDAEIRRDQTRHLIELADRYNITVQIVPTKAGPYPGIMGSITIMECPDRPTIVYAKVTRMAR